MEMHGVEVGLTTYFAVAFAMIFLVGLIQCLRRDDDEEEEREYYVQEYALPPPPPQAVVVNVQVLPPPFPYAQAKASEHLVCAICFDELLQGQMCSKVPACRHVFHEPCIRAWARKVNTCPLCRVSIVTWTAPPLAADRVAAADDMV